MTAIDAKILVKYPKRKFLIYFHIARKTNSWTVDIIATAVSEPEANQRGLSNLMKVTFSHLESVF